MTKSSDASQVIKPIHCFVNLHDFLKTKRGIFKYAKRTNPNYNWKGDIEESQGSFWIGDRLLCNSGSSLVFLAKNRAEPSNPNSDLPTQIVVKSCFLKFCSTLQHEKEVLCNLGPYRNVVRCYGDEITTTKSGEKIYNVLLEYCSGSNLKDHITKFGPNGLPESEVRRYTRDIVHGLYHIHCNARYIHGDIKPRNILLWATKEEGCLVAKIANFGLAKKLSPEVLCDEEIRGSGPYISPELGRDGYLDWPADIWALGCLVLEMLTGKPAWSFGNNTYMNLWDYYNNELLPEIPNGISSLGRDFIKRCLIRSPYKRRPTWLLIKHPFVSL